MTTAETTGRLQDGGTTVAPTTKVGETAPRARIRSRLLAPPERRRGDFPGTLPLSLKSAINAKRKKKQELRKHRTLCRPRRRNLSHLSFADSGYIAVRESPCQGTSRDQSGAARIRSDSFDGLACRYRVFVANSGSEKWSPAEVVAFDSERGGRESEQSPTTFERMRTTNPSLPSSPAVC